MKSAFGYFAKDWQRPRLRAAWADAGIEHRFAPTRQLDETDTSNALYMEMGLVIDRTDEAEAIEVLRKGIGLFPLPDDGAPAEVNLGLLEDLVILVSFDREALAEALDASRVLAEAGISFLWRDGRDSSESLPDAETIALEVRALSLARAQKLLEEHLASQT